MRHVVVFLLICFVKISYCRDFYFGMFAKNDFLVAADELYRPMSPSRITYAKYGKVFKCPITYFRVVDRLGSNASPRVEIIRGGIQKKFIVVRLSVYNRPISVNIYVGCHNKNKHITKPRRSTTKTKKTKAPETESEDEDEDSTDSTANTGTEQETGDTGSTGGQTGTDNDNKETTAGPGGETKQDGEDKPDDENKPDEEEKPQEDKKK